MLRILRKDLSNLIPGIQVTPQVIHAETTLSVVF